MDEREASAEGIVCANEGVMEEFRARQQREDELGGTLAVQSAELAQQRATVDEMKVRAHLARRTSLMRALPREKHACGLRNKLVLQNAQPAHTRACAKPLERLSCCTSAMYSGSSVARDPLLSAGAGALATGAAAHRAHHQRRLWPKPTPPELRWGGPQQP